MGHGGEFGQNVVHWRREWQTTSVFLPWEHHEQYEKTKRYDTEKWTPQVGWCQICYWRSVENNSRKNEEMKPKQKRQPTKLIFAMIHQESSTSFLSLSIRGQTEWKSQSQKTNQSNHMDHSLSNSMKIWAMPYRATQGRWVMVESLDKM